MQPRHQVSRDAIELIKRFEGFRRASARLPDGRWTIGYGHTRSAREGVEITEADAEALLIYDLVVVAKAVNELTFTPLTQNQFDALVSFAMNVGIDNFRTSAVLRRVNEGALLQAAYALEMWRKTDFEGERIVLDALVRRRAAEKALFLRPTDGYVPAPSPVLPPRVDYDAAIAQPVHFPLNLVVPMEGDTAEAHRDPNAPAEPEEELEPAFQNATAAVEAVTARLQALMPELEGQEVEPEALAPLDASAPDAVEQAEAPDAATEVTPAPPTFHTEADQDQREHLAASDHPDAPTVFVEELPVEVVEDAPHRSPMAPGPKRRAIKLLPYGPVLAAGLALFFAGVFWGVQAKSPYGLLLALVGVVLMAVGVYYLLKQIDERPRNGGN